MEKMNNLQVEKLDRTCTRQPMLAAIRIERWEVLWDVVDFDGKSIGLNEFDEGFTHLTFMAA